MKPGYLATLASRALGSAPVLMPRTPSRFEPDRPAGGVAELEVEAEVGATAEPRPEAGGRVSHLVHPGPGKVDGGRQPVPMPPAPPGEVPAPAPLRSEPLALWPPEAPAARAPAVEPWGEMGVQNPGPDRDPDHAPGPAPDESAIPLAAPAAYPALPRLEVAVRPPRDAAPGHAGDPIHLGQDPVWADRLHDRAAAPAIVVRIGRVDVRAVHAPPPPPPAPRPAAHPTQSLADYLAARERGRR